MAMGLHQMRLTILVMNINQKFFISGFTSLLHKSPNMDTLVALGSGASFAYSTYALFAMTGAQMRMDMDAVTQYMGRRGSFCSGRTGTDRRYFCCSSGRERSGGRCDH